LDNSIDDTFVSPWACKQRLRFHFSDTLARLPGLGWGKQRPGPTVLNTSGNLKLAAHRHLYQGITDTIVQLPCLHASDVIAAVRAAQPKQPDFSRVNSRVKRV